jgi:hypothetical protein
MVCDDYVDDKVAMEVSALRLIRNRTPFPSQESRAGDPVPATLWV